MTRNTKRAERLAATGFLVAAASAIAVLVVYVQWPDTQWEGVLLGIAMLAFGAAFVLLGCALQALLWLPILLLPVLLGSYAIPALLVLLVLYHSANNLAAPQWTSIMRDLVSEHRSRGRAADFLDIAPAKAASEDADDVRPLRLGDLAVFWKARQIEDDSPHRGVS